MLSETKNYTFFICSFKQLCVQSIGAESHGHKNGNGGVAMGGGIRDLLNYGCSGCIMFIKDMGARNYTL